MKRKFIFLLLVFKGLILLAQGPVGSDRVLPPSPTAASLGKYGDINIGYYTGTANINIPIYQLTEGDIKVPISLNGAARAFPVSEVPGWVGAGFSLQSGGVITRSTAGLPDDYPQYGYLHRLNAVAEAKQQMLAGNLSYTYLDNITHNQLDLQPDIYSYNFNGYSGRFYIDVNGHVHSFTYDNTVINFHITSQTDNTHFIDQYIDSWTVSTPDGFQYTFDAAEWARSSTTIGTNQVNMSYVSSWYLTNILSPLGRSVNFSYSQGNSNKPRVTESYFQRIGYWKCNTSNYSGSLGQGYGAPTLSYDETIHLTSITTPTTSISFETTKRNDLYQQMTYGGIPCQNPYDCQDDYKLDRIKVRNSIGVVVKQVDFSYEENPGQRLKLIALQEQGKPAYTFEYNGDIPVTYSSPDIDHWGYYNGASNTNLIPVTQVVIPSMGVNGVYGMANRDPSFAGTLLGSLKKINYPTGGSTKFDYEQNNYYFVGSNPIGSDKVVGGLRISKITTSDGITPGDIVKEYVYDDNGHSTGTIGYEPKYQVFFYGIQGDCNQVFWLQSASVFPLSYTQGNTVGYYQVKESRSDGSYVVYNYTSFLDYMDEPPVFSYPGSPIGLDGTILQLAPRTSMDHRRGLLTNVQYKDDHNQLIKSIQSEYTVLSDNQAEETYFAHTPVDKPANLPFSDNEYFPIIMGYKMKTQWQVKTKDIETTYNPTGQPITVTKNYYYENPTHIQLTKTIWTDSRGSQNEEYMRYPGDIVQDPVLSSDQQQAANTLAAGRQFNMLLESGKKVNGNYTTRIRLDYKQFGSDGHIVLADIKQKWGAFDFQLQRDILSYDVYPNIAKEVYQDGITHQYLWDYTGLYPTMELSNSASDDFGYTSFEANNNGYWNVGNANRSGDAVTGNQCYDLRNGNITRAGLDLSKTYIISWWSKPQAAVTIAGAANPTLLLSKNGWNCWETTIAGSDNIIISGNGLIDELRLYPKDARMNTYTYNPLIGMTSQCDANNKIIYYEYDSYGRLILLRDQDKNILKKICYNYTGQQETCPIMKGNTAQSGTFTPNNCASGDVANGPVIYSVQANTYFGDTQQQADAVAQADINANGQAYANRQPGVCVPGVPNDARSATFTRNNCYTGQLPEQYTFTVAAGQYYALTKAAANQLADAYIAANGQSYTNSQVRCLIPNRAIDDNFYSQNCPAGQSPQPYHVVIPAGKYYDAYDGMADNMARADAQAQANASGGCAASIPTVYARLEIGPSYPDLQEYGIYITFWSDAQMSAPANVPDGLSLNILSLGYDELWINGSLDYHNNYSDNITQWGFTYPSSIMLDDIYFYDGEDDSSDDNGNEYVEKWKYDYTVQAISSPYVNIIMLPPSVPAHLPGY